MANTWTNTVDGRDGSNEPDDFKGLDAEATRLLAQQIENIKKAKNERRLASQRVTDQIKDTLAHGFDRATLMLIVKLSEMEPEDREAFLHRLDEYATKLRYY